MLIGENVTTVMVSVVEKGITNTTVAMMTVGMMIDRRHDDCCWHEDDFDDDCDLDLDIWLRPSP